MTDAKGARAPGFQNPIEAIGYLIDRQAQDDGLWFVAETAAEAYLQAELRKLHAEVEPLIDYYRRWALGEWKRESGDG